ncbi:MAG: heavy-metal-associated domain-containing protein [Thermoplasmatales archaeon]|nr:heavy-metal-associated domain-containing protein [Thermoplasmatales archaeon]
MMCGHCEARAVDAVKAVPGVKSAKADHKRGEVSYRGDADPEAVKEAIRKAGYEAE